MTFKQLYGISLQEKCQSERENRSDIRWERAFLRSHSLGLSRREKNYDGKSSGISQKYIFGKSSKIRKNTYRKIINDFKNKFKMSTKDKLKIKNY